MTLTPKQERFCQVYVETGNASEAYRQAYDAEKMKPAVINVKACELLSKGNISVRVKELQQESVERHRITVDDLLAELEEARIAASTGEKPQAGAMVAATMGKAKLLGLEAAQKIDHTTGGEPFLPTRIEIVSPNDNGKS